VAVEIPIQATAEPTVVAAEPGEAKQEKKVNIREVTERALLAEYAPACVTVSARGEILYIYGRTGKYLELTTGEMSANILRAAREGLRLELATALRKVVTDKKTVRYDGLTVKTNGDTEQVNLIVKPADLYAAGNGTLLVIFEPVAPERPVRARRTTVVESANAQKDQYIAALERELHVKDEYLQSTVEELETANEELKSTNEELQSTNEELQSTNEELETSKEELQSVNEELVTVNTELQQKIEDLSRANNDMNNLLAGTGVGTIFLDHQQSIQRFTPAVTRIIPLLQTDIGRPLEHFASTLMNAERLHTDIQAVLDRLAPREAEVQTRDGHWYMMRILPYRTLENVIEGAVLTFFEITEQKRLQESLRESEQKYRTIVETAQEGIVIAQPGGSYVFVNQRMADMLGYPEDEILGKSSLDFTFEDWKPQVLATRQDLHGGGSVPGEFKFRRKDGSVLWTQYSATPIFDEKGEHTGNFAMHTEITERKGVEEALHRRDEDALRRFAVVLRDANDAITVQDFVGRILAWNPAAEKMYGWSAAEALAMNIRETVPADKRAEIAAFIDRLARGESIEAFETQRISKAGQKLDVRLTVTALVDAQGKPYAIATTERQTAR
jgi:two-component system CheB/CheR fusion protein